MSKVFISHSREDRELIANVKILLKNIGDSAVVMEYMPKGAETTPPYAVIRQEVETADYVMLFKTDNAIKSDYTKNWIIFEVGLAAAWNKQLFVFERQGPSIHFPIPYVTDYMIFNPQNVSDILKVQSQAKKIKEKFEKRPKDDDTESGIGLLLLAVPELFVILLLLGIVGKALSGPLPIICSKCNSRYRYYADIFSLFQCPVCLTSINPRDQFKKPSDILRKIGE